MIDDLRAPYRIAFDNARDPYTARNTLGIENAFITSVSAPLAVTGGNLTIDLSGAAPATDFPSGAWTNWTPTFTPTAGALTSTSLNYARYTRHGKAIFFVLDVVITNAGTAAGTLLFTLPFAAASGTGGALFGRERAVSGYLIGGHIPYIAVSASTALIARYDGASPMISSNALAIAGLYEVA